MRASEILALAVGEIGVTEYPPDSNNVKYNTAYYGREVYDGLWGTEFPWCATFIWWLFKTGGAPELYYGGNKTASCTTLMNYYGNAGQLTDDPVPGDLVFMRFSGKSGATHIGILESIDGDEYITIEGNTSANGSQDNGGAVMRKRREISKIVAFARPEYEEEEDMAKMTAEELAELLPAAFAILGDKPASEWAQPALDWCREEGIMTGDEAGNQMPLKPMLRQECAQIIKNILDK